MQKNKSHFSKLKIAAIACLVGMNVTIAESAKYEYLPTSITSSIPLTTPGSLANLQDNGCNGDGVEVTFTVPDTFTVSDVDLGVNILHSYRRDLHMKLSSPITSDVFLATDIGGSADNFSVRFDSDPINSAIPAGLHTIPTAPPLAFQYTATPENPTTLDDNFIGDPSNGDWVFFLCDNEGADIGTLESILLILTDTSSMSLVKSAPSNNDADGNGYVSAGDTLTYTITATNDGDSPLNNVVVSDPLLTPSSNTCPLVAVAGTCVLNGNYVVQGADELVGSITNMATADSNETSVVDSNTIITPAGSDEPNIPEDVYYMPLPENDALSTFQSLYFGTCGSSSTPSNPVSTYSSITVLRSNTIIYYDHHENGYEADTLNPQTIDNGGTTEVWGDENIANGFAPGSGCTNASPDSCDILNAGIIIVLDNQIDTTTNPEVQDDFDGGDKITATDVIAMTKANWATGSNTLLAGAFEMYPTNQWGTEYQLPIGQNIANPNADIFQYVGITIMAQQDDTIVTVDLNGPDVAGGITTYAAIDEGGSIFVDGGILVGATVSSNFDVQVDIMTGDICANYEARFFTLFPTALWDNSYYNPVGTEDDDNAPVRVFLYNPADTAITILVQDNNSTATVTVQPGSFNQYRQDENTGAQYCTTSNNTTCDDDGSSFYAVAAIDSDDTGGSQTHDWGFALVPQSSLSQQALVGLGFGQDPLLPTTENSSPVWITANMVDGSAPDGGTIQICVDYDNDGTDVGNPTLVDPVTGNEYDVTYNLGVFASQIIYDPDGDQTSMLVWICDAADLGRAVLAVAWGQDPATASAGPPAIDVGTGVPNAAALAVLKEGLLTNDLNGDGFPSIGDTITYLIKLTNVGFVSVDEDVLIDNLPPNVAYIPGTTRFRNNLLDSYTLIPDESVPPEATVFPLDDDGLELPGFVLPEQTLYVTFDVTIETLPLAETEVCNSTSVNIPVEVSSDVDCMDYLPRTASLGNFVWNDINQNGIQDGGLETGIEGVTVTLLDNMGQVILNGIGNPYTTTTAADGSWLLENLPAGDYQVRFDTSTATDGQSYESTAQNQGNDETEDSDSAPTGVLGHSETNTFTLTEGETNNNIDAGFYPVYSVIGNRVWLDLDSDGVQDANEDGIANVEVSLSLPGVDLGAGVGNPITTVTDSEGNYIFKNLPIADGYVVAVTALTLPSGLQQTYDEDDGFDLTPTTANSTIVNLTQPNEEYLTADFGYIAPSGSIGDYIWADANADGQQDPNEIGIPNVDVYLCLSNVGTCDATTPITEVIAMTTTDITGHYLFTGIDLTAYHNVHVDTATLPLGYTLSSDPDTVADSQTTVPSLNTSGNINLNADFGYLPPNNMTHFNIGDTIYQDLNGDGSGVGEPGIPGVTVQLFVDTTVVPNDDGLDNPDTPIASAITDSNGNYLFPSLPQGVAYSVLVTDANNILNGYVQTGDPDAVLDNQSTINSLTATDLDQDFGYKPVRAGTGVIGDKIFNSLNGQGFEGVNVRLVSSTGDYVGKTTTDENGNYLFTGLDPTGTYTVEVDTNSLPNGGVGWSNNVDPDGGNNSTSEVTLSGVGIDLDQDFGYIAAINNTIRGTVWRDDDGNGELTDGSGSGLDETTNGINNVTVVLLDTNGNIVATTTTPTAMTDGDGEFTFTGLPDGTYFVVVTDDLNELANLQHTDPLNPVNCPQPPTAGADNCSQDDTGYSVTVSGGEINVTADFGYKPVVTTPITLASFKAIYNQTTGETVINWSTLTETGNIGFDLYYQTEGVWVKANAVIIASKEVYSTTLVTYEYIFEGEVSQEWAIVDIDIKGKRQSHGVYNVNQLYGFEDSIEKSNSDTLNRIKAHHDLKTIERNQQKAYEINQYIKSMKNKVSDKNGAGS